jgi:hypothetical protein
METIKTVWAVSTYYDGGIKLFAKEKDAKDYYESNQDIYDYYVEVVVR